MLISTLTLHYYTSVLSNILLIAINSHVLSSIGSSFSFVLAAPGCHCVGGLAGSMAPGWKLTPRKMTLVEWKTTQQEKRKTTFPDGSTEETGGLHDEPGHCGQHYLSFKS